MMKPILILLLTILLLLEGGPSLFAKSKGPKVPKRQTVVAEKVEIRYAVQAGRVTALKGSPKACKADNAFVVAALQGKRVNLEGLDYTVDVTKLTTGFVRKDSRDEMVIYEYRMDLKKSALNKAVSEFMDRLQVQKTITGGLLPYGMPVTCHYLVSHGQLVLLSYYGFPEYYEKFNSQSWIDSRYF
jgi:formaldehyde-activating enzyme involved in methanogenesis